jgi:hypothetical protein
VYIVCNWADVRRTLSSKILAEDRNERNSVTPTLAFRLRHREHAGVIGDGGFVSPKELDKGEDDLYSCWDSYPLPSRWLTGRCNNLTILRIVSSIFPLSVQCLHLFLCPQVVAFLRQRLEQTPWKAVWYRHTVSPMPSAQCLLTIVRSRHSRPYVA